MGYYIVELRVLVVYFVLVFEILLDVLNVEEIEIVKVMVEGLEEVVK